MFWAPCKSKTTFTFSLYFFYFIHAINIMSSSSPKPDHHHNSAAAYSTPPALIAFTLVVVVVCFMCFSVVYFCRCYFVSIIHTWALHRSASGGTLVRLSPSNNNPDSSPFRGLDPSLLQAFPTFTYSSVKDLREEKRYSLECAICLLEFEDGIMLRLLTFCRHLFHQDCIDLWLRSHKTCPVCRTDLETRESNDHEIVEEERRSDVCIDVKEGEEGDHRFARSHSTGHSIVMVRGEGGELGRDDGDGDDSRYTLRLQDHAALRVVRGGHNYTRSCSSYKEMMIMVARPVAPCTNCGYVQAVSGCSSRGGTENI